MVVLLLYHSVRSSDRLPTDDGPQQRVEISQCIIAELESSEGKEARDAHAEASTSRFVLAAAAAAAAWDPGVVRAFPPPLLLLLASWAL